MTQNQVFKFSELPSYEKTIGRVEGGANPSMIFQSVDATEIVLGMSHDHSPTQAGATINNFTSLEYAILH
ncbi:MAG: hypothetical protein Ct9H90mP27_4700 [Gammaproteobacteria bacterium]|nr:MAG: hypothetical protein Ct9H90mP27_4700 [Gammaproteobacteria bacterium]